MQVSLFPRGCLELDTSGATHPADISKKKMSGPTGYCIVKHTQSILIIGFSRPLFVLNGFHLDFPIKQVFPVTFRHNIHQRKL